MKTSQVAPVSPLFDFAPMALPDWGTVVENVCCYSLDPEEIRAILRADAHRVATLTESMERRGVDPTIIEKLAKRMVELALSLEAVCS